MITFPLREAMCSGVMPFWRKRRGPSGLGAPLEGGRMHTTPQLLPASPDHLRTSSHFNYGVTSHLRKSQDL